MTPNKEQVWKKLKEPAPLFTNCDGGWPSWANGKRMTMEQQIEIVTNQKWMLGSKFTGGSNESPS